MNKKLIHIGFSAAAILFSASPAAEELMETIITTATRTPQPISEVLSVTTVITRDDIERFQSNDIFDLLGREAGISFVRNGGRGSSTSLLLRGNQSDHTLFLIDGIRIGSATLGSANLGALNMNLVERVEIIRGPKSTLYGADAIGGVINVITRTSASAEQGNELNIDLSYGSNRTTEASVVGGISGDNYSLSTVLNLFDTDGIDNTENTSGVNGDEDGYENNSISINYGYAATDDLDLRLVYSRNQGENDYDSSFCLDSVSFASVDCQFYTDSLLDTFAASADYRINDRYSSRLQLGQSRDESEIFARNIDIASTINGGIFNTTKREATWLNFLDITSQETLTLGFDYSIDEVDGSTDYDEDSRDNKAAFAQLESEFDFLSLNFGIRYDDNEQFGSKTTRSVQAGYQLNDQIRLIGSYAEGFKAPTFNDLYFPGFGNPTFVPEESENYEIAIQGQQGSTNFYAAFYKNDVENLIQFDAAFGGANQVAKASISGFEFDIDVILENWEFGIAGNALDAENESTGNTLRRRPEQMLSVDADSQAGIFSYGASVRSESHRYDDAANNIRLGGYVLFDLRAAAELSQEWKLEANVNNLFDKHYSTANDFSLGSFQPVGRELFVSISYRPAF